MRTKAEPGRAGFTEALASEWAKFRTVRSTRWTLAAMAAFVLGIAVFVGATRSLQPDRQGRWWVLGPDAAAIGELAAEHRIVLQELTPRRSSLEEVYVQMTDSRVEYRAKSPASDQPLATTSKLGG